MIKIENVKTYGWEAAIRGMRNPMNSWERSDTIYRGTDLPEIGRQDMKLMKQLFAGGPEHRKYLRMIHVSMDITAPLYWWKEFDTYKIGTAANSCSTMHKLAARPFELADFSTEHLTKESLTWMKNVVIFLNYWRDAYNEHVNKECWWQMIQLLPSSYNQRRTVDLNYEVAARIIHQRSGHKLDEWNDFVIILRELPYLQEIIG